jgi:hypothetical protein
MFNFFKTNPIKKLQKLYAVKMEQALQAQRNGKMGLFAELSAEAQDILNRIKVLSDKDV